MADLPELPGLPKGNALNDLMGYLLIAQSNPALLPAAQQAVQERDLRAQREAELRFSRELQVAQFKSEQQNRAFSQGQEAKRTALEGRRTASAEASERQTADYENKRLEAEALQRSITNANAEQALKQERDFHLDSVIESLTTRAAQLQQQLLAQSGRRNAKALKPASPQDLQRFQMSNPQVMREVALAEKAKPGSGQTLALQRYAEFQAESQQATGAAEPKTLTKMGRETAEAFMQLPGVQLQMKNSGLTINDVISPSLSPLRDMEPHEVATVWHLTKTIAPKLAGLELNTDEAHQAAADLMALGLNGRTAVLNQKIVDAITQQWEIDYGKPREEGEQLLNELISQNLSPEAIEYATPPTVLPKPREGLFQPSKRGLKGVGHQVDRLLFPRVYQREEAKLREKP